MQSQESELHISEAILKANQVLEAFNWQVLHPYIQVYKIKGILSRHKSNQLTQSFVSDFFVHDFYDLNSTISFTDGFFARSNFIGPFNYYIEYSLILCFQRDYAGAINLIIPSIEGSLIRYLTEHRKMTILTGRRYREIKNAGEYLKEDLISGLNHNRYGSETAEIQSILGLERKYLDNWFSVIDSFLRDSLFAHSDQIRPGNHLNRHAILHRLDLNNYHTLENYIKLFNALRFLCWAFLQVESKSVLNKIDTESFISKRIHYEQIIENEKRLSCYKHSILKNYTLHNTNGLKKQLPIKSIYTGNGIKAKLVLLLKRTIDNKKAKSEIKR